MVPAFEGTTPVADFPLFEWSFVSGDKTGERLSVRYFCREADRALLARVRFGPRVEGPPGHAHGGSIAALLDEAMGMACWITDRIVVAARLTVDFKAPVPLGTEAVVEATVIDQERRKIRAQGRVLALDGTVFATGEGLFIQVDPEKMHQAAAARPRPL